MLLTVLGNPDRYLAPLEGGSGYLFEAGGARVLLDCGPGVARALADLDPLTLDAVVVTHFHYDHCLDLLLVLKAVAKGTPLFVPPGARGNLAAIARAYGFEGAFDAPGQVVEARAGEVHSFKKARVDFAATAHSVTSLATRVRTTGRAFVYASDTAPCQGLHDLARKADLALVHTLLARVEKGSDHEKIHMTAEAAGEFARIAQVRRLILSHRYWESKDDEMLEAARAGIPDVKLASRGTTYEIK